MMYLHYCNDCQQIFLLSGHQQECLKCGRAIQEIKIPFDEYVNYSPEKRMQILSSLSDDHTRTAMLQKYRFSKRTKRYQQWTQKCP